MAGNTLKTAVVGARYFGIVTAVGLLEHGRDIMLVEQDRDRRTPLTDGRFPFCEPGLPETHATQDVAGLADDLGADAGPVLPESGAILGSGTRICDRATALAGAGCPRRSGPCQQPGWTAGPRCVSRERSRSPMGTASGASHGGSRTRSVGLRASESRCWAWPSRPTRTIRAHLVPWDSEPSSGPRAPTDGAHDPAARDNARRALANMGAASTAKEPPQGADAQVIATGWPVYRDLDWAAVHHTVRRPLIIDGRRLLPRVAMRALR